MTTGVGKNRGRYGSVSKILFSMKLVFPVTAAAIKDIDHM